MGEPKPFASLSSGLLARKGQAKPAMRPQGFAGFGLTAQPGHDDLGWNDMGHDPLPVEPVSAEIIPIAPATVPAEQPAPSEPLRQQEELARELDPAPEPVPESAIASPAPRVATRAAPGSRGKAAFTLRLDPARHLKLRLVCAVEHRSAQMVVLAALDAFLDAQPSVAELAQETK